MVSTTDEGQIQMTDLGRPSVLLGLNISYGSEGSITLYAETYIYQQDSAALQLRALPK